MKTKKQIKALEKVIENVSFAIKSMDIDNPTSIELVYGEEDNLTKDEAEYIFNMVQDFEIWDMYQENMSDTIWTYDQLNELLSEFKIEYANQVLESKKTFKVFSPRENKMIDVSVQNPILSEFENIEDDIRITVIVEKKKGFLKEKVRLDFTLVFGKLANGKTGYVIFGKKNKLEHTNLTGRTSSQAKMNAIENETSIILEDALVWLENKYDGGVDMVYNLLS